MSRGPRGRLRPGPDAQLWLPVAAVALVVVADLFLPADYGLLPVYAAGPALAAAYGPVRWVWAMGALAVVCCLAAALQDGLWGRVRLFVALIAIGYVTIAAAYVSHRRLRTERELDGMRAMAGVMERVLLSPVPAAAGPWRLAASYESPAAARIGGDLYEAVPLAGRVRIIVADVQGKGLDAVRVASVVLAAFRESAPYAERLPAVCERIELALGRRTEGDRFVTAVLADAAADGTVTMLNRGHPAPLVVRPDGTVRLAEPAVREPPFGLAGLPGAAESPPAPTQVRLAPGERLLFYTDGVIEARDPSGRFYPLLERAGGPLTAHNPAVALRRLREDVQAHTQGPQDDDSALLLAEYRPAG